MKKQSEARFDNECNKQKNKSLFLKRNILKYREMIFQNDYHFFLKDILKFMDMHTVWMLSLKDES